MLPGVKHKTGPAHDVARVPKGDKRIVDCARGGDDTRENRSHRNEHRPANAPIGEGKRPPATEHGRYYRPGPIWRPPPGDDRWRLLIPGLARRLFNGFQRYSG